jgi:hypothetical protein
MPHAAIPPDNAGTARDLPVQDEPSKRDLCVGNCGRVASPRGQKTVQAGNPLYSRVAEGGQMGRLLTFVVSNGLADRKSERNRLNQMVLPSEQVVPLYVGAVLQKLVRTRRSLLNPDALRFVVEEQVRCKSTARKIKGRRRQLKHG